MENFLVEYEYDGGTWGFQITASDFDDAQRRLSALHTSTLMGRIDACIPAPRLSHLSVIHNQSPPLNPLSEE